MNLDGFFFADGKPVTQQAVRAQRFITGKARLQSKAVGVVELDDGTVRTFLERIDGNTDHNDRLNTVGEPLRQPYEAAVEGLAAFEADWITERCPEFISGPAA